MGVGFSAPLSPLRQTDSKSHITVVEYVCRCLSIHAHFKSLRGSLLVVVSTSSCLYSSQDEPPRERLRFVANQVRSPRRHALQSSADH